MKGNSSSTFDRSIKGVLRVAARFFCVLCYRVTANNMLSVGREINRSYIKMINSTTDTFLVRTFCACWKL